MHLVVPLFRETLSAPLELASQLCRIALRGLSTHLLLLHETCFVSGTHFLPPRAVRVVVRVQVTTSDEGKLAKLALVWPFSCLINMHDPKKWRYMRTDVRFQVSCLLESFHAPRKRAHEEILMLFDSCDTCNVLIVPWTYHLY